MSVHIENLRLVGPVDQVDQWSSHSLITRAASRSGVVPCSLAASPRAPSYGFGQAHDQGSCSSRVASALGGSSGWLALGWLRLCSSPSPCASGVLGLLGVLGLRGAVTLGLLLARVLAPRRDRRWPAARRGRCGRRRSVGPGSGADDGVVLGAAAQRRPWSGVAARPRRGRPGCSGLGHERLLVPSGPSVDGQRQQPVEVVVEGVGHLASAGGAPRLDRHARPLGLLDRGPVGDGRLEDLVAVGRRQLVHPEPVLGGVRAQLVDQDARRPQPQVVALDEVDGLQRRLRALEREQRRLGDDERVVGGGQRVAREPAQRRRCVDEDEVVAAEAAHRDPQLQRRTSRPVTTLWRSSRVSAAMTSTDGPQPLRATAWVSSPDARVGQHVGRREAHLGRVEDGRGVALRVEVDDEGTDAPLPGRAGEPEDDRGLAHPALEAHHADDEHGPESASGRWARPTNRGADRRIPRQG